MRKRYAQVRKSKCVACGTCIRECPRGAIEISGGCYAKIEKQLCVGCGKCAGICPAGCIDIVQREKEDE